MVEPRSSEALWYDQLVSPSAGKRNAADSKVANASDIDQLVRRLHVLEGELEKTMAMLRGQEGLVAARVALAEEVAILEAEVARLHSLRSWAGLLPAKKWISRFRVANRLRQMGVHSVAPTPLLSPDPRYQLWIETYDTLTSSDQALVRTAIAALPNPPIFSVIMPTYNPPRDFFEQAIESVLGQWYPHFELCVADDASTDQWVLDILGGYAARDERVKVVRRSSNGHISAASNSALGVATGDYVALIDHDDLLAPHALALVALAIGTDRNIGLCYSDEDHIDGENRRSTPYMKSEFDPLLLLGQNFVSHLSVIRRDLVERVGRFREGFEGSQDWDLVLRVSELLAPEQIVHLPFVLYHWRVHESSTASSIHAKPYAAIAGRRAVLEHLERGGIDATVSSIAHLGFNRLRPSLPSAPPAVSILILARRAPVLLACLDALLLHTTYPTAEIVIVDDGDERPPFREMVRDRGNQFRLVRILDDRSDAGLRNAGVAACSSEVICFLDDEVIVTTDRWLTELIAALHLSEVGAVGPKILDRSNNILSAGLIGGVGGTVGALHRGLDRNNLGYFGRAHLLHGFSALLGTCLVVRRVAFEEVGGFTEDSYPTIFPFIDLCLRMGNAGWRIAFDPYTSVSLHESSITDRPDDHVLLGHRREIRTLRRDHPGFLGDDPAYSPNLSLAHEIATLAWPPRVDWRSLATARLGATSGARRSAPSDNPAPPSRHLHRSL